MYFKKFRLAFVKSLCFLLIITAISPTAYASAAIKKAHWADKVLAEWTQNNFLKTNEKKELGADQTLTRAQLVALINNAINYQERAKTVFIDVPENAWYLEDIEKAVAADYLHGSANSKGQLIVRADQIVTRQEAVTLLMNVFRFEDSAVDGANLKSFTDSPKVSPFAVKSFSYFVQKGYISGFPDKTLKPNNSITLAEAITIISKITGEILHADGIYQRNFERNVTITSSGIELSKTTINGNLYLSEGIAEGEVALDQVVINGDLFIYGGGENSIKIKDSSVKGKLVIEKKSGGVRVYTSGETFIPLAEVHNQAFIEAEGKHYDKLSVSGKSKDASVKLKGSFNQVVIGSVNANLTTMEAKIESLSIDSAGINQEKPVLLNLDEKSHVKHLSVNSLANITGEGKITKANVQVSDVSFEKQPDALEIAEGAYAFVGDKKITQSTTSGNSFGGGGGGGFGGSSSPYLPDVEQAKAELKFDIDLTNIRDNLILPTVGINGTSISWSSSQTAFLSNSGEINRPALGEPDVQVVLAATISKSTVSETKIFNLTIKAKQQTEVDEEDRVAVWHVREMLTLGDTTNVESDLLLPVFHEDGVQIHWSSNNPLVIDAAGHVTRHELEDKLVILTAVFNKGAIQDTKEFLVIVKASSQDLSPPELVAAKDALSLDNMSSVTSNVYLPRHALNGVNIVWNSSDSSIVSPNGIVNRPPVGGSDVYVTLAATLSYDNFVAVKLFHLTIKVKTDLIVDEFTYGGFKSKIDHESNEISIQLPQMLTDWPQVIRFAVPDGILFINQVVVQPGELVSLQNNSELTIIKDGEMPGFYRLKLTYMNTGLPSVVINTENAQEIVVKETKIKAQMRIFDGSVDPYQQGLYDGEITIKGRGNSSWGMPKKSYAITTSSSVPLLDMPKEDDWVLIANYADKSLMRNFVAYNLGEWMGMAYSPRMKPVDLFLNGEFLGTYLLGEKIKISKSRLDIHKMNNNDRVDEAITGGYLIEKDWLNRLDPDDNYFNTSVVSGENVFALKQPKASKINTEQLAYITDYFNVAENALYGETFKDAELGYANYFNVDSIINWYIINELFKNHDAAFGSSVYLHKNRNEKITMGPLWDFDIGAGNIDYDMSDNPEEFYIKNAVWISRFFEDPAFVEQVKSRWNEIRDNELNYMFEFIDQTSNYLRISQQFNFQRWPILGTYVWPNAAGWEERTTYESEVNYLKDWLQQRILWLDQAFSEL